MELIMNEYKMAAGTNSAWEGGKSPFVQVIEQERSGQIIYLVKSPWHEFFYQNYADAKNAAVRLASR